MSHVCGFTSIVPRTKNILNKRRFGESIMDGRGAYTPCKKKTVKKLGFWN